MLIRATPGAHRLGAPCGCSEPALDQSGGYAVSRVVRVGAAGEDGGDDLAVPVDDGAARVAGPNVDPEARYGALHRAPVVGVAGDHTPCRTGARGPDVERAVLGEAEHGGRLAHLRRGERHRVEAEAGHA